MIDKNEFIAKIDGTFEEKIKKAFEAGWDSAISSCAHPSLPGVDTYFEEWKDGELQTSNATGR